MTPVIALLSDFGLHDHYVGAMKGVILGIAADATIVDITHDIPPQDLAAASFELAASHRYFPHGTIFVCVVDPSVGTTRKAIAAVAGGYTFLSPDNGLLTLVLNEHRPDTIVELANARYQLADVSRTFEGRDRFAPCAAWLARGVAIDELGPRVRDWARLDSLVPSVSGKTITGSVVRVDRFGNLITNIDRALVASTFGGARPAVHAGDHRIEHFVTTYAEAPERALCALFGSSGFVEIAANRDNAARQLALDRGSVVRLMC